MLTCAARFRHFVNLFSRKSVVYRYVKNGHLSFFTSFHLRGIGGKTATDHWAACHAHKELTSALSLPFTRRVPNREVKSPRMAWRPKRGKYRGIA